MIAFAMKKPSKKKVKPTRVLRIEVPRENIEVFEYEDTPEFLKKRKGTFHTSLLGPFKRTA